MKTLFLCLLILGSTLISFGQEDKSPIVKFITKRGYQFPTTLNNGNIPDSIKKWPDTLYYNTVYKAKLLGSPTIPISFSKIEYVNGKYEVSPTISIFCRL